jgi:uncharacterized protein YbjT (DUF2867 family)
MKKILLTVTPFLDYAGSIPNEFVSRHLARQLIEEGFDVHILADKQQSTNWPVEVNIINGSITSPSETPLVFENIDAVFLAGAIPETVYEAVNMAKEAGVKKIVTLSSHGPEIEIQFTPDCWYWLAIEVVVERSGLHHTRIVPSNIMASTLVGDHYSTGKSWAELIREDSLIQEPYVYTKVPLIHEEDLACVIAKEFDKVNLSGKTLHVYGHTICPLERKKILSKALNKELKFKELSLNEAFEYYRQEGLDEHNISHRLGVLESISTNPIVFNSEVETIIGRPLKSYSQWVDEHISYFNG